MIKTISFQLADATTFIADKNFDYIVSFSTFHWIKDKATALKHIFSMLKPGGKLAILMRHQESEGRAHVFASKTWKPILTSLGEKRFYCNQEIMHQLLAQAGFIDIHMKEHFVEVSYENKQTARRYLLYFRNWLLFTLTLLPKYLWHAYHSW